MDTLDILLESENKFLAELEKETEPVEIKPNTPPPKQKKNPETGRFVPVAGQIVMFTGDTHFSSESAIKGKACTAGIARVEAVSPDARHPYKLVRVPGQGASVFGWVSSNAIEPANDQLKVGLRVNLMDGANTYSGKKLSPWDYKRNYFIKQISGDRVVIAPHMTGPVTAAVYKDNLVLV